MSDAFRNGERLWWSSNRGRTREVEVVTTMKLGGGVMVRVLGSCAKGEFGDVHVLPPRRLAR